MLRSRSYLILLVCCVIAATTCNATPLSFSGKSKKISDANDTLKIPVTELYKVLPIEEVPTTIAPNVRLSNKTRVRYGYSFGRPVSRVERFLDSRFGLMFKPQASDIWALGCVLHELMSHSPPFTAKTQMHLFQKIKEGIITPLPRDRKSGARLYSGEIEEVVGRV